MSDNDLMIPFPEGPDEQPNPDPAPIGFVFEVESDGGTVVPPDEND